MDQFQITNSATKIVCTLNLEQFHNSTTLKKKTNVVDLALLKNCSNKEFIQLGTSIHLLHSTRDPTPIAFPTSTKQKCFAIEQNQKSENS